MRPTIVLLCQALLMCGCSSAPPRPATPDGSSRVPVNSPQSIERYRNTTGTAEVPRSPDATERRLALLESELAALRRRLGQTLATPPHPPRRLSLDGAELVIRTDSTLLRLPQPLGRARCTLRPAVRALLLSAAMQSAQIDIRGRTDAERGDRINQQLAERRAGCAQRLLLAAGVPADRLHTSALAAGDFIADNRSAAGRARNRRVDIELKAPDPAAERAPSTTLARSTP